MGYQAGAYGSVAKCNQVRPSEEKHRSLRSLNKDVFLRMKRRMMHFATVPLRTIKGSFMFEALAVLGILMVATPAIVKLTQQSLRAMHQVVYGTQLLTERIAITEQVTSDFRDINGIVGSISGCCVQNSTHVMCYDTKKGRFRRRKRKRSSTRFYTHYIGEHSQWDTMMCSIEQGVFLVRIAPKYNKLESQGWPLFISGNVL